MKTKAMIFCMALVSWGTYAQHDHSMGGSHDQMKMDQMKMDQTNMYPGMVMFTDVKLSKVYGHYIHLKDALIASNSSRAKKVAGKLQKSLKDVGGSSAVRRAAVNLAYTADLVEQRKAFSSLSNEMTALIKDEKLSMGNVYLQYCPKANNNQGAYWLSNEKQIGNPYLGDKMLTCGSVKATFQ